MSEANNIIMEIYSNGKRGLDERHIRSVFGFLIPLPQSGYIFGVYFVKYWSYTFYLVHKTLFKKTTIVIVL